MRQTNAEASLTAAPLAAAMTVNALFIVGLLFVPRLWTVVEMRFPLALIAFLAIGVWALVLMGRFLGRILAKGGAFDMGGHNSFAQLLPGFTLAMVAVGLSSPAAMSVSPTTDGLSLILSTFFGYCRSAVYACRGHHRIQRHTATWRRA